MTNIGVINVGIGNIGSLVAAIYNLGWDYKKVNNPNDLKEISHLILPGVGAFNSAMQKLQDRFLVNPIIEFSKSKKPLLGICLGMQLLANIGHENVVSNGLGIIEGDIKRLKNKKLPHIGWNSIKKKRDCPIFKNIPNGIDFYFVHSYCFKTLHKENIVTVTKHEQNFVSAIHKDNIVGVQFHPEKSQKNGLKLLDNFCMWDGKC